MTSECKKITAKLEKIIKEGEFISYDELIHQDKNKDVHSWLQYALIKSGVDSGLEAVPEIKITYANALKHKKSLPISRDRNFSKVDVGFFKEGTKELRGIAEVYTVNTAHAFIESEILMTARKSDHWLTPRNSLTHLVANLPSEYINTLKFFILMITLPKNSSYKPYSMKNVNGIKDKLRKKGNYYDCFKDKWVELAEDISKNNPKIKMSLVIIFDGENKEVTSEVINF